MVGKDEWTKQKKCNNLVSKATSTYSPKKQLVTPSYEAFIYVMFVNNKERWTAAFEHYKERGNWTANLPKQVKKTTNARGERVKQEDPFYDAKFTCSDSGQNRFGTFSQEGIDLYKKLKNDIREDRANEKRAAEIKELEMKVLSVIRRQYNISGECGAKRKTKNTGEGASKRRRSEKELDGLVDDDDDMDPDEQQVDLAEVDQLEEV